MNIRSLRGALGALILAGPLVVLATMASASTPASHNATAATAVAAPLNG
jgi:hypothetical protein